VQGVAEVVPVSSSAQLTLLPHLLDWEPAPDRTTFAASLHAGSAVGIYLAVRNDLKPGTARRNLVFALPAAVAGALGQKTVERKLGGVTATAAALGLAGLAMWWADRQPSDQPLTDAALNTASLVQVAALVPGISRAGATLTALRAQRVDRVEALEHTMHSSLPITLGAAGLTAVRARQVPELLPSAAAAVTAFGAAKAVQRGGSKGLITGAAIYRLVVAGLAVAHRRREKHA
jgi:undecaprenyl-diphosphatase